MQAPFALACHVALHATLPTANHGRRGGPPACTPCYGLVGLHAACRESRPQRRAACLHAMQWVNETACGLPCRSWRQRRASPLTFAPLTAAPKAPSSRAQPPAWPTQHPPRLPSHSEFLMGCCHLWACACLPPL